MNLLLKLVKQLVIFCKEFLPPVLSLIYYSGIITVIGWTLAKLLFLEPAPFSADPSVPPSWWTEYIIKPIVSSDVNRIIFKGLFYLFIWILLFMIIPLTTRQLKRFRLFQMEFEVEDKETAAVEFIELQSEKATILSHMYSDTFIGKLFTFLNENSMEVDYQSALAYFLEDLKISYRQNYHIPFEFTTCDFDQLSGVERSYAELSKETGEPEVINWERPLEKFKKNRLIFHFLYKGIEKVTILSSHSAQFDIIDKQNILFLHYALMSQSEIIEYAMQLEKEEWPFMKTPM